MLISSGFTDDLFPADEALRYYHRTRDTHPGTPLALFFGNFGHQRAQNRAADANLLRSREDAWLDFYVKGVGTTPFQGVEAQTLTCPATTPSGGPVSAANWAQLAPGEVRFTSKAAQSLTPGAGSTALGATFDPVSRRRQPLSRPPRAPIRPGVASYRLPAAKSAFTMMGAATVIADINSPDRQLRAGGEAVRRRARRAGDPGQPRHPASRSRLGAPGLPAPSQRLGVRQGPRPEAGAAAARRRPARSSPATRARPTARGRSRSPTWSCACPCCRRSARSTAT